MTESSPLDNSHDNPYDAPEGKSKAGASEATMTKPGPARLGMVFGWALLAVLIGSGFCAWMTDYFGVVGTISLWLLGASVGFVSRKLYPAPSPLVGITSALVCVLAFLFAETAWIHWNIKQGADSWWTAFTLLPEFAQEYRTSVLVGVIFTVFGAWSAYQQTTRSGPR